MNTILSPAPPLVEPAPLSRWTAPGLVFLVALFDLCFWDRRAFPGLALTVFFAAVALTIRLNRARGRLSRGARVLVILLGGALVEAAIESGFCNVLMLLLLTVAFAGETNFVRRGPGLPRWLAQLRALILAPFRMVRFAAELVQWSASRSRFAGLVTGMVVIVLPCAGLLLGFGALLSSGNAVFGLWMQDAFKGIWQFLPEITFWRGVVWMAIATTVLPLLWPKPTAPRAGARTWNELLSCWPELVPAQLASLASGSILAALNALFAVANYADAVFLWHGGTLPAGVNYSQFVHEGVEMLIATVLLSALVLAWVFNQNAAVAGRRGLKLLGGLWIAQNLFLLASTARRLDLYIEAYGASVERASTLIFLVLVAAGFGLLAVKIARGKSLAWLLGGGLMASFATLYLAQFLNLAGWVADYNVARWERDKSRDLDACYLSQLGPAAWPVWTRAEKLGAIHWVDEGRNEWPETPRQQEKRTPRTQFGHGHWHEFSLRAWWNRDALQAEVDNK